MLAMAGFPRRRAIPVYVTFLALLCLGLTAFQVSAPRRPPQIFGGTSGLSMELNLLRSQVERLQETLLNTRNATLGALDALALPTGTVVLLVEFPAYDQTPLGVMVAHPDVGAHAVQPLVLEATSVVVDVSQQLVHRLSWQPIPGPPPGLSWPVAAGDYICIPDTATGTRRVAFVVEVVRRGVVEVRWTRPRGGPPTVLARAPRAVQFTAVHGMRWEMDAGEGEVSNNKELEPSAPRKPMAGPARFLLFSFADGHLEEMQNITWATVERYAARHGYSTRHLTPEVRTKVPIHFSKYSEMLRLFDLGYEWVVWLDADIAITNPNVTLEWIVQNYAQASTNLIIARDPWSDRTTMANMWCPINSGVFLMRASRWSGRVLELIATLATMKGERYISFPKRRRFDPGGLVDQPVLTQVLVLEGQINLAPSQFDIFYRTEYHRFVSIVPQRVLNSALRVGAAFNDHPETVWRPGDWVVHVTGEKNLTKRIKLLRHALKRSSNPPAVVPAISDTIAIPTTVDTVVHEHADQLQSSTLSLRQAQLVGAAIHARVGQGGAKVLVWCGARVGPHAALWHELNPGGRTVYFVDAQDDSPMPENSSTIFHVTNPIPLSNERGDNDLALALLKPCTQVCVAARTRLTLLPPMEFRRPWDVIVIDDPLLSGPTNQMVYTASLLAFTAPNHTTDIILLNAEHRMVRRYSDAFLGTHALYNTYACPSPDDPDCPGSFLMHWRVSTTTPLRQLDAVFRTVEKSWATQREAIEKLLRLQPSPNTASNVSSPVGSPFRRKGLCVGNACRYVSPKAQLSSISSRPSAAAREGAPHPKV